jgi:small-conductance mechanosensitive channel
MLATIQDAFKQLAEALAFAPKGVAGALVLALAALIALVVHEIGVRVAHRLLLGERYSYLRSLLLASKGPTRLALLVLAMFAALPAAGFDPDTSAILARILSVTTIGLAGWILITAVHLAGDLYLLRFKVDGLDNLLARKHVTQVRVLRHVLDTLIVVLTIAVALMTFEPVRQYGVSLFASAGVAGLVAGLAARPMLSNLIAGIQIATTQPIRLGDEVMVENQWGRVDEITSTYVVLGLWDLRQLIVPLSYFIEKPFENWTRESTKLIGAVTFHLDYTVPIERLRSKALEIVKTSPHWDGDVASMQVSDAKETSLEVKILASARSSGALNDLRGEIREKMLAFLQQEYPACLPRLVAPRAASEAETAAATDAQPRRQIS